MLIKIDATGLGCPKPVINTKKELDKIENGTVRVTVDNSIAKENILKLSKSLNCKSLVREEREDLIIIDIEKGKNTEINSYNKVENNLDDKCIFISSDKMGQGSDELGHVLMKGYIYTLTETKPYPKCIIFVNSGVKLTSENKHTVENLKIMENDGVQILSCGTCLDYYNLKESLDVGSITNMYNIVEAMQDSSQTISI